MTTDGEHLEESLLRHLDTLESLLLLDGRLDDRLEVGPVYRSDDPSQSEEERKNKRDDDRASARSAPEET